MHLAPALLGVRCFLSKSYLKGAPRAASKEIFIILPVLKGLNILVLVLCSLVFICD